MPHWCDGFCHMGDGLHFSDGEISQESSVAERNVLVLTKEVDFSGKIRRRLRQN